MQFDVGIVIPFYNAFRGHPDSTWFQDSIESALKSEGSRQVILVDDGSDDGSLELARKYTSQGVELVISAVNRGVAHALNLGIEAADAKYIATQGSDDLCKPEKSLLQSCFLDVHPELQMCGCFYWHCDQDGALIMDVTDVKTAPRDIGLTLLTGNCKIGAPMFRKSLWEELGGFDDVNFPRCAEDFDFFLRVAERDRLSIGVVPEILYGYRDTPNSITKSPFFPDYFRALDKSRERRKTLCKPNWGTSPKALQS